MMRLKRLTALALALMLALSSAALAQADGVAIDSLDKTTYDGLVESALGTQTDETAEYTVYRTGSSIDPEAEDGLVIVSE